MRGSVSRVSTASLSPITQLSTPAGAPASSISSASRSGQLGSFSEGFSTKVLPAAMATANIHIGTMRSEEHTSELQSLMRISYAVFCLKKKKHIYLTTYHTSRYYIIIPTYYTKT